MPSLSTMLRLGFGSNSLVGVIKAGLEIKVSHKVVLLVWFS